MTLSRLTILSYKVKPMADPVPAHLPSKSRLSCCAIVEYHPYVLPGTEWVMFTSSRLNCFSVPHWLLEKWGTLSVKWCVTDEAAQVTLCARWKTPHHQVQVNSGYYSCFHVFFPSPLIIKTRTIDIGLHRYRLNSVVIKLLKPVFKIQKGIPFMTEIWPWANYNDAEQLLIEY